ncbi:RNase H family protein [Vibrio fluvialis]|uniref:RNase H family protein n=1 Tax=Vibrio fluvialis TaxID=676 RepID=UPI0030C7A54D
MTKWIVNWKKNGWRKSNRTPVLNADLWRQLDTLNEELSVTWEWVKGHAGYKENEEADALAKQATPRK